MSRSASDIYTRFTSTSPHASSRPLSHPLFPPSSSSSITTTATTTNTTTPSSSSKAPWPRTQPPKTPLNIPPGPPNETPQEKVARLRAASRLAKAQASISPLDRVIERGRRVADATHRVFAYGLIGFAGLSTLLAVYAATDLVVHNRRQKRAWIDRELQRLQDAQQAFVRGEANAEQLHLLRQEKAGDEMVEKARREKERRKSEGWWGRGKTALGFAQGVEPEQEGYGARVEEEVVLPGERRLLEQEEMRWVKDGDRREGQGGSITNAVTEAVEDRRREGEKQVEGVTSTQLRGGQLDVLAGNVTGAVKGVGTKSSGWLNGGRGTKDQS